MSDAPILGRDVGPVVVGGKWRPLLPSTIIDTPEKLHNMIAEIIKRHDEFVCDVETRGVLKYHPYLKERIDAAVEEKVASYKRQPDEDGIAAVRRRIEGEFQSMLALDPQRNEVFWVGFAVHGKSWAIPMGHRYGKVLIRGEEGDGSGPPPPGYRRILKDGSESLAKKKYKIHPVLSQPPPQLERAEVMEAIRPLFFDHGLTIINHNLSFDLESLAKYWDDEIPDQNLYDTLSGQHVLDEETFPDFKLPSVIKYHFDGHDGYARDGKLGKLVNDVDFWMASRYVHRDVRLTHLVSLKQRRLQRKEPTILPTLKQDMETLAAIMRMEQHGTTIDVEALESLRDDLQVRIAEKRKVIDKFTAKWDEEFNPASDDHKRKFLFDPKSQGGLGLKPGKVSKKTGRPSVDAETMESLAGRHPIIPHLLEYADLTKVYGTYVIGYLNRIHDNKVHPRFLLHGARTGRLSSENPNAQNLPRYTGDPDDLGSLIRQMFIAPPGYVLVVFDYSQIEMRIIAGESGDKKLVRSFLDGEDIHARSAAAMLRKPIEEVTKEERQLGKQAGFAIGYGAGADKVAATARKYGAKFVDTEIAEDAIENFYRSFPGVIPWKESVLKFGRKHGFVETSLGRRRRLPDLQLYGYDDRYRRYAAERQAVNFVVQGTAAHIAKQGMIEIDKAFKDTDCHLLLAVHDEVICEVPEEHVDWAMRVVPEALGHGTKYKGVPIIAEGAYAHSWAKAKG